jgi:hypothetical protein
VGLRSTYDTALRKDNSDPLGDSTRATSESTGVMTMTYLQKQSAGNIKAPELAAIKLTELLVTLGVAAENTGGTILITTGVMTKPGITSIGTAG